MFLNAKKMYPANMFNCRAITTKKKKTTTTVFSGLLSRLHFTNLRHHAWHNIRTGEVELWETCTGARHPQNPNTCRVASDRGGRYKHCFVLKQSVNVTG